VAGGGLEQCYNAQAVVTADSLLVVAADVVQAVNDKQQLEPMLGKLAALPADLGAPQTGARRQTVIPAPPMSRPALRPGSSRCSRSAMHHHPSLNERFAVAPPAPKDPTPLQAMARRLATPEGKRLYAGSTRSAMSGA
jgi:hypothetical protein